MMGGSDIVSGPVPRSKSGLGEVLLRLPALELGKGACATTSDHR
jgi:hypothetical protein